MEYSLAFNFFGNINNTKMYVPIIRFFHIALIISLKQNSRNEILDPHLCVFLRLLDILSNYHLERLHFQPWVERPRYI